MDQYDSSINSILPLLTGFSIRNKIDLETLNHLNEKKLQVLNLEEETPTPIDVLVEIKKFTNLRFLNIR